MSDKISGDQWNTLPRDADADTRARLRYAVQREILCARTQAVLDLKDAVYYSVRTAEGRTAGEVVTGDWWDRHGPAIQTNAALPDAWFELTEVIDGRIVFPATGELAQ